MESMENMINRADKTSFTSFMPITEGINGTPIRENGPRDHTFHAFHVCILSRGRKKWKA